MKDAYDYIDDKSKETSKVFEFKEVKDNTMKEHVISAKIKDQYKKIEEDIEKSYQDQYSGKKKMNMKEIQKYIHGLFVSLQKEKKEEEEEEEEEQKEFIPLNRDQYNKLFNIQTKPIKIHEHEEQNHYFLNYYVNSNEMNDHCI